MWKLFGKLRQGSDLEIRLERLERAQRDLRLDWDASYEKFGKLYARLAKRARREEQGADVALESTNGGGGATPGTPRVTNPLALELLRGRG